MEHKVRSVKATVVHHSLAQVAPVLTLEAKATTVTTTCFLISEILALLATRWARLATMVMLRVAAVEES